MQFSIQLPMAKTQFCVPLVVMTLAILAFLFDEQLSAQLIYHRTLITQSEFWRLFTGHFFHTNFAHLALNLSALILLWTLHGQFYTAQRYAFLFVSCALFTSMGLYYFSQDLQQYVGLSGVLHGIFVWGALLDIKHHDKTGYLLFIGVWLKIAYEQVYGASTDVIALIDANVAVDAHLWGAVAGLVFGLLSILNRPNAASKNIEQDSAIRDLK